MKKLLLFCSTLALLTASLWAQNTTNPPGIRSDVTLPGPYSVRALTNTIIVTNAGRSAVNGTYYWYTNDPASMLFNVGIPAPAAMYTNGNYALLVYDPVRNFAAAIVSNTLSGIHGDSAPTFYSAYNRTALGFDGWALDSNAGDVGPLPVPQVSWGSFATNNFLSIDPRVALQDVSSIGESYEANRNTFLTCAGPGTNIGNALLYLPAGTAGIVSSIKYTASISTDRKLWTNANLHLDPRLRMWADPGAITNLGQNLGTPTLDIPIEVLQGAKFGTNAAWGSSAFPRSTQWLDVWEEPIGASGKNIFRLHANMPFGNGCVIEIVTNGVPIPDGYSEVTYTIGGLSTAQQNLRLRSFEFSATNTTASTIGTNLTFFTSQNPGVMIATFKSVASTDASWPESMWTYGRFATDAEDESMNPFYFAGGTSATKLWGTTTLGARISSGAPASVDYYRMWDKVDAPVWFAPIAAQFHQNGGTTMALHVLTLYYGP